MKYVSKALLLMALFSPTIILRANQEAGPAVAGLELDPNGSFTFDRLPVMACHFDLGWNRVDQRRLKTAAGYPKSGGAFWETQGELQPRDIPKPITLRQRLDRLDAGSFRTRYEASHPTGAPTREIYLQIELPVALTAGKTVLIDGQTHTLPVELKTARLAGEDKIQRRTLVVPGATGTITIEGDFSVLLQDARQWRQESYTLRLRFSPQENPLTKAALELTFRHAPYRTTTISLRETANQGFSDDVAGDGRGGWTDEGPENDLRSLPAGPLQAAGVSFDILDESANQGRGAIVVGPGGQGLPPKSVTVPLAGRTDTDGWRNLYLLHASGRTPPAHQTIGRVILLHADGTESRHDIVSGRDVGDWSSPSALENGALGWRGETPNGEAGLYVSRLPLAGKPVREIRFESAGPALWMIAALSASPDNIVPSTPAAAWTAAPGAEWAEHVHELDIEPGSVFDFSHQVDAPAGKHGPVVITPEGHFAFRDRPGERVRFWGVNLCFSANFLKKDVADRLAERLARSGYNSVRFHHYDRELQKPGGASWELDPEKLDRLDYLFAAMKKHGIYINLDLYTSRTFSPEEFASVGFPPLTDASTASGEMHWRFKAILPVSERAFDIWGRFTRNLMTHRNPYTGLTWGEDPAVVGICPVNEDAPRNRIDGDPVVSRLYQERFAAWRALPENKVPAGEDRARSFNRFVYETQIEFNARLRAFLHDLGVTVPLTGTNHRVSQGLAFVRQHHDYVDNHRYWDHPTFPQERFRLPFQFRQVSASRLAAEVPRDFMPTRIVGKPFVVTEFNFVRPNSYRAEGGVLMPAYAGLQDWDALYNFDYASNNRDVEQPGLGGTFSIAADPVGQIADRVGAAIFLRGDIAPAPGLIGFAVQPGTAFESRETPFPGVFSRLGLVTRIGSRPATPEALLREPGVGAIVVEAADHRPGADRRVYPAEAGLTGRLENDGVLPRGSVADNERRYRSETGQIELRTDEGTVKVVTPRSELFVLPPGAALSGDLVAVRNGPAFGTVIVLSVDGQPLARSSRLLVTHLTDSLLTGMRFSDRGRRVLETRGELPHLLRRGTADLTLKLGEGGYRAWAVSPSGARLHEVPLTQVGDGWRLQANTVTRQGTQLAYEIARE